MYWLVDLFEYEKSIPLAGIVAMTCWSLDKIPRILASANNFTEIILALYGNVTYLTNFRANFDLWTSYIDKVIPAEFAILKGKYDNVIYAQLSLGMRFRAMFETNEPEGCTSAIDATVVVTGFLASATFVVASFVYVGIVNHYGSFWLRIGANETLKELKSIGIKTTKLMEDCEAAKLARLPRSGLRFVEDVISLTLVQEELTKSTADKEALDAVVVDLKSKIAQTKDRYNDLDVKLQLSGENDTLLSQAKADHARVRTEVEISKGTQ
nr:auxin response factor 19-like [Tanacetum cinerariifolium]